jgi:hypothetical protein
MWRDDLCAALCSIVETGRRNGGSAFAAIWHYPQPRLLARELRMPGE